MKKVVFVAIAVFSGLQAIAADHAVSCDDERAKYCIAGERKYSEGYVIQSPSGESLRCTPSDVWASGSDECRPLVWAPPKPEKQKAKR